MKKAQESTPFILGINASHNGSVCLLKGNRVMVAIQEERLSRIKRQRVYGSESTLAVQYCLDHAGITAADLDIVAISVQGRAGRQSDDVFLNKQLRVQHHNTRVMYLPHHFSHAVSAYAASGFEYADILVIDGTGSPKADLLPDECALAPEGENLWESLSCYQAVDLRINTLVKEMRRPSDDDPEKIASLGWMFETVSHIIFGDRQQAGKVMGLAAYGQPSIPIEEFVEWRDNRIIYTNRFVSRFSSLKPWPENCSAHKDLACSVQHALEYAVLKQLKFLREQSQGRNLCYAGGVALNTLLNERIIRESGYEKVFILPAAEDSGVALGAAYYALWKSTGQFTSRHMTLDSLGHRYSKQEIQQTLVSLPGILSRRINNTDDKSDPIDEVVERLCAGEVGAWFQGGAELGPRALGQRSMLCDARSKQAKDYLNHHVKFREGFRPFAPVVLQEHAAEWFDLKGVYPKSPFMLRVASVLDRAREKIPAITHEDGTARLQTVSQENGLLYTLLQSFYRRTGVPVLLNTSLNVNGEPIVETPEDAWLCLQSTPLTFCMMEDVLITKKDQDQTLLNFCPRLHLKRYSIDADVHNNHIDRMVPLNQSVTIWSDTPWGEVQQRVPMPYFNLLLLVNGRSDGWELLRKSGQDVDNQNHQKWMIQALQMLHRKFAIRFNP